MFRLACRAFFAVILFLVTLSSARAQNRVDLDDLNIKGELLNDNRLRMSTRDPHKLADRVSYRTNFRKEITDGLEIPWPDQQSAGRGPSSSDGDDQ